MPGQISLFNPQGVRLTQARYHYTHHIRQILARWSDTYEDKFKTFHYHVAPEVNEFPEDLTIGEYVKLKKAS
jgi:hypothetical protein